jgi:hypothetical protein
VTGPGTVHVKTTGGGTNMRNLVIKHVTLLVCSRRYRCEYTDMGRPGAVHMTRLGTVYTVGSGQYK